MKAKTPREQLREIIEKKTADELYILLVAFRYAQEHPDKTPEECVMLARGGNTDGNQRRNHCADCGAIAKAAAGVPLPSAGAFGDLKIYDLRPGSNPRLFFQPSSILCSILLQNYAKNQKFISFKKVGKDIAKPPKSFDLSGFYWSCQPDLNWRPHPYQLYFTLLQLAVSFVA